MPEPIKGELVELPAVKLRKRAGSVPRGTETEKAELGDSLDAVGQCVPIDAVSRGDFADIIDGERRYDHLVASGATTILTRLLPEGTSDETIALLRIVPNTHVELDPIELARRIHAYQELSGCTAHEAAKRCGRSAATVSRLLALLDGPAEIQELVRAGKLAASTAYALLRSGTAAEQVARARQAAEAGLSREAAVRKIKASQRAGRLGRRKITIPVSTGTSVAVVSTELSLASLVEWLARLAERARQAHSHGLSIEAFLESVRPAKSLKKVGVA